ncbi:hypothetical protein ACFQ4C_15075 [Larkinella insperata]|uniref:Entericidin n=1 Tax=Larkinella insperata TaxID=332158 RepID=A0ABW3QCJ2_9BACT|nr:hypothetical protein [Larkinella insperata]
MKKVLALLFVGSMITFAACQSKPKTEETSSAAADSAATVTTDSSTMATDSATAAPADSAAADTTK